MTAPPTPIATWRTWFPALVRLPDGRLLAKSKVYATNAGLYVYVQANAAGSPPVLAFSSPILLDKTVIPGTDYASEQRGHVIVTEAGNVTVNKSGACSCSMRSLKAYTPAWSAAEATWGVVGQ